MKPIGSQGGVREPSWKELLAPSLSLTITSASYLVLGLTDMWFVGRLGTAAQAGVGIGLTLTLAVGAFVWGVLKVVEVDLKRRRIALTMKLHQAAGGSRGKAIESSAVQPPLPGQEYDWQSHSNARIEPE